jgi:hypothetical protein
MISINGREVRLIQAHIAPEEQRMEIRYTQSFDFDHCPQEETLDLFARWLLGEPLSPDKALSAKGEAISEYLTETLEASHPTRSPHKVVAAV